MLTPAQYNEKSSLKVPVDHPMGFKNVPVFEKQLELCIEGTIPSWVNGVLYRTGSGIYNILLDNGDTFHVDHPFDSLAMVHRFEICGERQTILYNSRNISSGVEKRITENDPTLVKFGPDLCKTIFGRMQSVYHHLVNFRSNLLIRENEPEFEVINTTITPNFPIGEQLENELNIKRGEALVTKHDVNFLQVIDHASLKPLKMITYDRYNSYLEGPLAPAHHHFDEETNEFVNFVLKFGPFPTYQLFSIGPYLPSEDKSTPLPPPEVRVYEPIWRHLGAWKNLQSLRASYIHSFSMTKNYVIIPNYPYYFKANGLSILYYSSAYQSFAWDPNSYTLFHVIDRHTGKHVATYEAEPCFAFHTINAWDEEVTLPGGYRERVIYMDICTYDNADIVEASFELGRRTSGKVDFDKIQPATYSYNSTNTDKEQLKHVDVRRYHLGNVPVSTEKDTYKPSWLGFSFKTFTSFNKRRVASYTRIGYDLEMPCINQKYNLKPYRYVWGVCSSQYAPNTTYNAVINGLIKLDLSKSYTGSNTEKDSPAKIWDQPGCSCSEPIFIPNPEGVSEDDGVIMSVVNHTNEKGEETFFILILNAITMKEMGRSTIGKFNAFTLHGSFVDKKGRGVTVG